MGNVYHVLNGVLFHTWSKLAHMRMSDRLNQLRRLQIVVFFGYIACVLRIGELVGSNGRLELGKNRARSAEFSIRAYDLAQLFLLVSDGHLDLRSLNVQTSALVA